jgi:hypothetical protein
MSVSIKASNGVGYNYGPYTVTAADQSATYVIFDFNSSYSVAGVFLTLDSSDAVIANTGAVVTFPAAGQMKIANGGAYTLTAGQKIIFVGGIAASLA